MGLPTNFNKLFSSKFNFSKFIALQNSSVGYTPHPISYNIRVYIILCKYSWKLRGNRRRTILLHYLGIPLHYNRVLN